jgi:hypothetical protein
MEKMCDASQLLPLLPRSKFLLLAKLALSPTAKGAAGGGVLVGRDAKDTPTSSPLQPEATKNKTEGKVLGAYACLFFATSPFSNPQL